MIKNIVVTGNIGAGKSTLVEKLTKVLPRSFILSEPVSENPYIDKFYIELDKFKKTNQITKELNKVSLEMQLFLHYFRLTQQFQLKYINQKDFIIQDRYLYDQLVFSQVMVKQGILSPNDYDLFYQIFNSTFRLAREIDDLIYLSATPETLMKRIEQRNRDCEKDITIDYISALNDEYDEVFKKQLPHVKHTHIIDYNNITDETFESIIRKII
jgi:deoxyadenosine/deoxycytidine kinase